MFRTQNSSCSFKLAQERKLESSSLESLTLPHPQVLLTGGERPSVDAAGGSGRGSYLQSLAPVCQLCLTGRIRSWGVLLYRNVTSTHVLFLTEGIYMCMCIQPLHELW